MLSKSESNGRNYPFLLDAGLGYTVLIAFFSWHHDLWRDEVRGLTLAAGTASPFELYLALKNEGHPLLWYFLLQVLYKLFHSPLVLKAASVGIAAAAAFIFLGAAPFSRPAKILWLLGVFPIYEYSVQCRSYGLNMMLLFAVLACWPQRFKRPLLLGALLFLLANTSVYGAVIAAAFVSMRCGEQLLSFRSGERRLGALLESVIPAAAGVLFCLIQVYPDQTTIVTPLHANTAGKIIAEFGAALLSQGSFAHDAFCSPYELIVPLMVFGLYFLMILKPPIVIFLFSGILGLELLHRLVYSGGALRHQGFALLIIIAVLWLDRITAPQVFSASNFAAKLEKIKTPLLSFSLIILVLLQVYLGGKKVNEILKQPRSSAKALSSFVQRDPSLRDAVILAEPGYLAETLPYYLPNELYFPREKKYGKIFSFTSASKRQFSLTELRQSAEEVSAERKNPVLIIVGHSLESPGEFHLMYDLEFSATAEELVQFRSRTDKLASFRSAASDENYELYRLR